MEEEKLTLNQLMILSFFSEKRTKTGEIAQELSMTKQGVLYHVRLLKEKEFIDSGDRITESGYEELYRGLTNLRKYLSESLGKLETALTWEAISDDSVSKGDPVYLSMKNGYMHASTKKSKTAIGTAVASSKKGDLVLIENISGTVSMKIGSVRFLVIKNSGNSMKKDLMQEENYPVGIIGEGAYAFCRKNNIQWNIEYASLEGAFDASTRALSPVIFVTERRFRFTLQRISEISKMYPGVTYTIEYI